LDSSAPGGISAGPGARKHDPISPADQFDGEEWEEELKEEDFIAAEGGLEPCECCGGKPLECTTPSCKAAGKCGCMMGETADDEEDESLSV
jgi:hypothetical protein